MSNRRNDPARAGRGPDLWSLIVGRGGLSLCLVIGLLVGASSAFSAEIVEVRVGSHAGFTRVVFELDRAAGYRIERADPRSDVAELVVSLEATTIPRRIDSSKSLIEHVEVEPSGSRAIARIRLVRHGLRLKEMILANPPRIVLDVLSVQPAMTIALPATPPKPGSTPKEEAVPSFDAPTFEEIVADLPGDGEPAPSPSIERIPESIAEPTIEKIAEEVAPDPVAVIDEPTVSTPLEDPHSEELAPAPESLDSVVPAEDLAELQPLEPVVSDPQPETRTARPMVVRTRTAKKDEGGGWMTWALVGGGVILLLVGGLLATRRMRGGDEFDFNDDVEMGAGDNARGLLDGDESPFAGPDDVGSQMDRRASKGTGDAISDTEEKSMDDMEVISRDQVEASLGGMPSAGGGAPEEFQQMMREMNRRVESLEGRIDELVDARDRLERQVAAQTEELRVQRAAIARTQRAVRNLARPEDGNDGQDATEPALRDPN